MNAQEWLNEEGFKDTVLLKNTGYDYLISLLMERYVNYKIIEIDELLFKFRNKIVLNGGLSDFSILKKFDEHFEIKRI